MVIPDSRQRACTGTGCCFDGAIVSDPASGDANVRFLRDAGSALRDHRPRPGPPGRGVLGRRRRRPRARDWCSTTCSARGARDVAVVTWLDDRLLDADRALHAYRRLVRGARARAAARGGRTGGREAALEAAAQPAARGPAAPGRRVRRLRSCPAIAVLRRAAAARHRACPANSWSPGPATSASPRRARRR